jgi:hypothetical protein
MGYGDYSQSAHQALSSQRVGARPESVFQQRTCHPLMNPKGVKLRESRDSAEHPNSLAIAFVLDVTGSMGDIPKQLAMSTLPEFMRVLGDCQVADPQILFCAVGDATSDDSPLQVGQFESTAELMDQWLTWTFLEGGGGGTGQESYELALYFLALHTELDCLRRRQRRGYLFMTGDELPYPVLSRHVVESVIGDRLDEDLKVEEVVAELQRSFVPYFIIPDEARRARCERVWRDLLGEHVLCLSEPEDVCYAAAGAIALNERLVPDIDSLAHRLEAAGADHAQVRRTVRALETLIAPAPTGPRPTLPPAPPSLLRRLFGRK